MIDPDNITNYKRTDDELLELFIFCVFVAGHNSHMTAAALDRFLTDRVLYEFPNDTLDECLRVYLEDTKTERIEKDLQQSSIGCFTRNAAFLQEIGERIITGEVDLRTASLEELESFKGVGPKTSRFFVMHSRKGVKNIAVLDTHILKFMGENGIVVPKSTPSGKRYRELEEEFLKLAKKSGKSLADFDLEVWKARRVKSDKDSRSQS